MLQEDKCDLLTNAHDFAGAWRGRLEVFAHAERTKEMAGNGGFSKSHGSLARLNSMPAALFRCGVAVKFV